MNNSTKSISTINGKALISFRGESFLGQIGIDSRIFKAFKDAEISVGIISQQAIENGVSVLVDEHDSEKALVCLKKEFDEEITSGTVAEIYAVGKLSILCIYYPDFSKILETLRRNKITPVLLNQTAAGDQINLVLASSEVSKASKILESLIYGTPKTLHLAIIGPGQVGKTLIEQILQSAKEIRIKKNIDLKIVAIMNSRKLILNENGFDEKWQDILLQSSQPSSVETLVNWTKQHQLENLIAIDNTASKDFVVHYETLVTHGFDLVSSNKIFNTLPIQKYRTLRSLLKENDKSYLYETNVGAGLPLIDTIKLLHLSGENITRIKGVFSGSLSYIFNHFSVRNTSFSSIIKEAMAHGFTEPDPREDLSGNDVARKLLILARELDLINEFDDIKIQNLIPRELCDIPKETFLERLELLDNLYEQTKSEQIEGNVLRYVGDLHGDLQQEKGILEVKLISVPASSSLGQIKGSDSIFEIYTESYGENPIVIMGAGAGASVTARGVFGDILRLSQIK